MSPHRRAIWRAYERGDISHDDPIWDAPEPAAPRPALAQVEAAPPARAALPPPYERDAAEIEMERERWLIAEEDGRRR